MSMINRLPRAPRPRTRLAPGLLALAALAFGATPAHAGKDSGQFWVILSKGVAVGGKQKTTIPAATAAGQVAWIKGTYVEFWVNLDTFEVADYTLTGAPARTDITGRRRTTIFSRRVPQHGSTLTGALSIDINGEQLVISRGGPAITMKIQAKDNTQGGNFQMEPSRDITYFHQLAPGFVYSFDPFNRVIESNGVFPGRESPETATLIAIDPTGTMSQWAVRAGGRMGLVLGEDALER